MKAEVTTRPLSARISPERLDSCAGILKALAHPIRLSIVDALHGTPMNVTHLQALLGLEQAVTSHHLSILRNRGVVQAERNGKHTVYSLNLPQLSKVVACMEECQQLL